MFLLHSGEARARRLPGLVPFPHHLRPKSEKTIGILQLVAMPTAGIEPRLLGQHCLSSILDHGFESPNA